ncbi:hypothetical protein MPLA_90008 [Mesorhizobium sp. ORS 3359]|nr:hypothetical protein MPLA_90008 [Mesorhizobium sp. ORS 3359]
MRETQFFGHLIDVFRPLAVQQIENPDPDLAREALQQVEPLKRIDNHDFIRHIAPHSSHRVMYQQIRYK